MEEASRSRRRRKTLPSKYLEFWSRRTNVRPGAIRESEPRQLEIIMAEKIRPIEQMLELTEEESLSPEHLDSQMQKAQEQLLQLKRQQEQLEKQKRELEELRRRQEARDNARAEMTDKLARALVVLEREAYNAQKRLEQLRATRESFGQHLYL